MKDLIVLIGELFEEKSKLINEIKINDFLLSFL